MEICEPVTPQSAVCKQMLIELVIGRWIEFIKSKCFTNKQEAYECLPIVIEKNPVFRDLEAYKIWESLPTRKPAPVKTKAPAAYNPFGNVKVLL